MGRNDEVLPYFKVGIYNSDGSAEGGENAEVTIRKYKESVLRMENEEIKEERLEAEREEIVYLENLINQGGSDDIMTTR